MTSLQWLEAGILPLTLLLPLSSLVILQDHSDTQGYYGDRYQHDNCDNHVIPPSSPELYPSSSERKVNNGASFMQMM